MVVGWAERRGKFNHSRMGEEKSGEQGLYKLFTPFFIMYEYVCTDDFEFPLV